MASCKNEEMERVLLLSVTSVIYKTETESWGITHVMPSDPPLMSSYLQSDKPEMERDGRHRRNLMQCPKKPDSYQRDERGEEP